MRAAHLFLSALLTLPSALICGAAPKVGVLLSDWNAPFGRTLREAFPEVAKQSGLDVVVKAPPVTEAVGMESNILREWQSEGGFDAFIVAAGVGAPDLAKVLQPAVAKGIPIVALLGTLPEGTAKSSILVDEDRVNRAAIELCAQYLHDGDEMSMIRWTTVDGQMNDREKVFIKGLRGREPNTAIHADVFLGLVAAQQVQQAKLLLEKHPNVKLVYSPYTVATQAMIEALRQTGRAGKVRHVGVGTGVPPECVQAIEGDELQGWIALMPKDVAAKAVETVAKLLQHQPVDPVVLSNVVVVTKDNLHSVTAH